MKEPHFAKGLASADEHEDAAETHVPTLANVLLQLLHLTYLELDSVSGMQAPGGAQPYLQGLQLLTRLLDLRLVPYWDTQQPVTASMLSGAHRLTRLQLSSYTFEARALAGKTALQHLDLHSCSVTAGTAGLTQLLFHLRHMHSLTYLALNSCLYSRHKRMRVHF